MDGRWRGPAATLMRGGLSVASVGYRGVVGWRNRSYDRGKQPIVRVDVPVISVGNLTTGGTGKTPLVAFLAKWFREQGVRVAIVSRGYGRGDADENDEAAELHQRLPDVPHVQDPDRVAAANVAIDELETQLILMDDGFQHRRLHRDFDIVLIDATCPFGYGHLLPRGLLREPVQNLRRADAVIVTRCDQIPAAELQSIEDVVRRHHPAAPIMHCSHRVSGVQEFAGATLTADSLQGTKVALLCGIGNPDAFRRTVRTLGARVISERILPDHAAYDPDTMRSLQHWVAECRSLDYVVCTQKDLVKIRTDRLGGTQLVAVTIDAEMTMEDVFQTQLERLAERARTSSVDRKAD